MYSVLIADDDVKWCEILRERISSDHQFSVMGLAHTGRAAIEIVDIFKPDIVLMDLVMPDFDGGYVIKYIREKMVHYNPYIYVLSAIGSKPIISAVSKLDIDFYSMKPVDVDIVVENMHHIMQNSQQVLYERIGEHKTKDKTKIIPDVFHRLGIPTHLLSTNTAMIMLNMFMENKKYQTYTAGAFYQDVALQIDATAHSVERNLRSTVKHMINAQTDLFRALFPFSKKVANKEFLTIISAYIEKLLAGGIGI